MAQKHEYDFETKQQAIEFAEKIERTLDQLVVAKLSETFTLLCVLYEDQKAIVDKIYSA